MRQKCVENKEFEDYFYSKAFFCLYENCFFSFIWDWFSILNVFDALLVIVFAELPDCEQTRVMSNSQRIARFRQRNAAIGSNQPLAMESAWTPSKRSAFSAIHVSQSSSKKSNWQQGFRGDLNRASQVAEITNFHCRQHYEGALALFNSTIETSDVHQRFLSAMLTEVECYHTRRLLRRQKENSLVKPLLEALHEYLVILRDQVRSISFLSSSDQDGYPECIRFLGSQRLYRDELLSDLLAMKRRRGSHGLLRFVAQKRSEEWAEGCDL